MSHTTTFEQLLAAKGISLRELGLREVGLFRAEALRAVELLSASSVPILGGDVYFMRGEGLEQAFANWHTEPHAGRGDWNSPSEVVGKRRNTLKRFPIGRR